MREEWLTAVATKVAEDGIQQKNSQRKAAKDLRVGCG
jgi:hypothetical protein